MKLHDVTENSQERAYELKARVILYIALVFLYFNPYILVVSQFLQQSLLNAVDHNPGDWLRRLKEVRTS